MIAFRRTISTYKLSTTFFLIIFVIIGALSSFQNVEAAQGCRDSDGDNAAGINPTFLSLNIEKEGLCIGEDSVLFIDECVGGSHTEYYCTGDPGDAVCHTKIDTCTCSSRTKCAAGTGAITLPNPLQVNSLQELLNRVLNLLIIFATPVYLLVIFLGALTFIVGGADPSKRRLAKNMLLYATIGFLILVMARVLLKAVETLLILK